MGLTADKFKQVFLGRVSDDLLSAQKTAASDAIDALGNATDAATTAGAPKKSVDFVTSLRDAYRNDLNKARPGTESQPDSYNFYVELEAKAKKQTKAALSLKASAEKLGTLKAEMLKPDGAKKIDALVAKIGTSAKTPGERGTLIAAMQARYDLDIVSGELTTKALPRLYKVLGMVPEAHARLNPQLKEVERTAKEAGTSDFGSKKIRIKAGEAGAWSSEKADFEMGNGKTLKLNKFDSTTLHEIGHSVDEAEGYMTKNMKNADHGGWNKESLESMIAVAVDDMLMSARWKAIPVATLERLAHEALSSGKIKSDIVATELSILKAVSKDDLLDDAGLKKLEEMIDEFHDQNKAATPDDFAEWFTSNRTAAFKLSPTKGLARMLANKVMNAMQDGKTKLAAAVGKVLADVPVLEAYPTSDDDLKKLEKDPGIIWCYNAREKVQPWYKGDSGADALVSPKDTRVYQEAYDKKYWSYVRGARDAKVSNYQFRAPGEWYAEAYAVYFMGKLPQSHPMYKYLKAAQAA